MTLSFDPREISAAERGWDDQRLYLRGARATYATASTDGFTEAVRGPAGRFATAWARHATRLAASAEAEADGIRFAVLSVLIVDERTHDDLGFFSRTTEAILVNLLREARS